MPVGGPNGFPQPWIWSNSILAVSGNASSSILGSLDGSCSSLLRHVAFFCNTRLYMPEKHIRLFHTLVRTSPIYHSLTYIYIVFFWASAGLGYHIYRFKVCRQESRRPNSNTAMQTTHILVVGRVEPQSNPAIMWGSISLCLFRKVPKIFKQ